MVLQSSTLNGVPIYNVTQANYRPAITDWISTSTNTRQREAEDRKHLNKLKKDQNFRDRIELIQDFEFPEASNNIQCTSDGRYLVASGVYKPQIRVYDLTEMSMKFERHVSSEILKLQILGEDWKKLALLNTDRSIELHTQGGFHFSTRLPKIGRDMKYDSLKGTLNCVGASNEVYSLNLVAGKFTEPMFGAASQYNCLDQLPNSHGIIAAGAIDCTISLFDTRIGTKEIANYNPLPSLLPFIPSYDANNQYNQELPEISAIKFDTVKQQSGFDFYAGTSSGQVMAFDLRFMNKLDCKHLWLKDHLYGNPIVKILNNGLNTLVTSDTRSVKFWRTSSAPVTGYPLLNESNNINNNNNHNKINDNGPSYMTTLECSTKINDVCLPSNTLNKDSTGLIMLANESALLQTFYAPTVGAAPRWCSFLDAMVEELEEQTGLHSLNNVKRDTVTGEYEDYKFVTRNELIQLGIEHMIGTSALKAHLHGYFIDYKTYQDIKSVVNPFAFEEYKKQQRMEKLLKQSESRIHLSAVKNKDIAQRLAANKLAKQNSNNNKPKVNAQLLEKIASESQPMRAENDDGGIVKDSSKRRKKMKEQEILNKSLLEDQRFAAIFENPEFQIIEE